MGQPVIQTSFNAGEWAPALNARVDLAKYHSGAALLRNFFVDYRGGATTRPGTKYILQSKAVGYNPRLIPFQASFTVGYIIEFGASYVRFYYQGAPVLEAATTISGATRANPGVITDTAHGYSNGDWIFINGVGGMTQLNGNYYIVANATANTYTLTDLNGVAINTTTFTAFSSNGTAQRIYTISSPYLSTELFGIKYAQNVNTLVICHPNHPPYQLVLNVNNVQPSWTLSQITFTPLNNPFVGGAVTNLVLNSGGTNWSSVPSIQFTASPGATATASCTLQVGSGVSVTLTFSGSGYHVGQFITGPNGLLLQVQTTGAFNSVGSYAVQAFGSASTGPVATSFTDPTGNAQFSLAWYINSLTLTSSGNGYLVAPSVSAVGGGGSGFSATATIGAAAAGNPTVPAFYQQRSFFGGFVSSPSQFVLSNLANGVYDFTTHNPTQAIDAITQTLSNTVLNSIKSAIATSAGLIIFADRGAWLLNGGTGAGSPISALALVANPQSYAGAGDLPPILSPNDILYPQSKGSIIRDLAYNFYLNNYTGADISVLSSHLFYTFLMNQWAWAEEPFKLAWVVRNDGDLLSLTFVKEQELVAWAHHDTQGSFVSVASITEQVSFGSVDAVYLAVQRVINGNTVNYIERFVELTWPLDYKSSWQVDAGIQYSGAPATNFSGAQHLAGAAITGVADGVVFTATVSATGTFTLGTAASLVTAGLSFMPQIQTLRLDLGEPTAQGKRKKIAAVTTRVANTLGLSIGNTFSTLVAMKDLILGNIGTMSNQKVTGLVTEDARTIMDTNWTVQGQVCIQQSNPYPASVLGVIPEIEVGDTAR